MNKQEISKLKTVVEHFERAQAERQRATDELQRAHDELQGVVGSVREKYQSLYDARSDEWQESDAGEAMYDLVETLSDVMDEEIDDIDLDWLKPHLKD